MPRATEDLKKSGMADRAKGVGDQAPDFSLKNAYGKTVELKELLSEGPVVLGYYRGKW
jgi:peroxiredoxin